VAWLRSSCPTPLKAQLKAERLMVIPSTANGFRATVSALRSLDPEDRCVRLLVKNLDRQMPESVVRDELQSLNIHVQGVLQLRSGRRDQDPSPHSPLHCVSGEGPRGSQGAFSHRTLRSAGDGGVVRGAKGPSAMPTLRPYAEELRTHPSVRRVWWSSPHW
jgi:hypothetical protein